MTRPQIPSVDVVIPTRDRPQLLRSAIDGVLTQTYPGTVEVVVVFDQSDPDHTLEQGFDNRRVRVIANTRSPGLAGARNSGILESTADLVAFCDDDDEWRPEKLQRQIELLLRQPDTSVVACGMRVHYGDTIIERRVSDKIGTGAVRVVDVLRDRLTELHPSSFLMDRTRLLDEIGLVNEEIPGAYGEDYEFLLRAAKAGPIRSTPTYDLDVHWHQQSYFVKRWETVCESLCWLLDRYPEFDTVPAGKARITGQIAFASAARGDHRGAWYWARQTIRANPREPRAYLALSVSSKVVSADRVLQELHRRGKGI